MSNRITDVDQLSIGGLYEMAVNDWRARVPWFEYSENLIKAILVGCFYGLNILFPQKKWLTFQRRRDILNIRKEKTMATLFNSNSPSSMITAISMDSCTEAHILFCNVPENAMVQLPNMTEASVVGESIFVRGVNSSFIPVLVSGKRYYVHEGFIRNS